MAATDKTYVNKEQLLEAIKWAKEIGEVTLENGYKFRPLNFIIAHNNINDLEEQNEYVLWNTPIWFDRWLWLNCPLSFIRERLEEVYDDYTLERFESWTYKKSIPIKNKYTFLETPRGHNWKFYAAGKGKRKSIYYISILFGPCEFGYNSQTDTWGERFGMLPYKDDYFLKNKVFSKKSIIRMLNKWNLPIGSVVLIHNLHYYGLDFKVLVKC